MRFLITGGTGFIGSALCGELVRRGHRVTVITRSQPSDDKRGVEGVDYFVANLYEKPALPADVMAGTDVIVNLAGENIGGRRWTQRQKRRIVESRTRTTAALVEAIGRAGGGPKVLLSGSAVGYYGDRGDEEVDEGVGAGHDFLAETCVRWEAEAQKAEAHGTRVVLLRTGFVLGKGGGALPLMVLPFRLFIGGPVGGGRQWLSWVHLRDVIGLVLFAAENDRVAGPLNITAPNPVLNKEMARAIGKVLHRPSFFPTPAFALKLVLGELAQLVLTGQRVVPGKALALGYRFAFEEVEPALRDVLS